MKKVILSIIAVIMAFSLRSQTTVCDSTTWAKEGTYDILPTTKEKEVFTTDLLCIIEANRKDFENVDLQISPLTVVRIYARRKVITNNPTSK